MINKRYELHEKLGEGGMGVVHRATDRLTGDIVALKRVLILPSELAFNSRSESLDLHVALAREFEMLAGLRHPNIISVLDYGFDVERQPYFTMPYLRNAKTLLEAGQGKPIEAKLRLILQTLQALAYLHRRGVLHRDLKPANVMVEPGGQVVVLDFGLAHERHEQTEVIGTVLYMAPEILGGHAAAPAVDLYAVGVMAYELLAGRHPFAHRDTMLALIKAKREEDPPLDELPEVTRPVMGRLLARDPAERFGSATAAISRLTEAMGDPLPLEPLAIRESYLQAASFVGRGPELSMLTEALSAAQEAQGSAWLVAGESGVGKTRLMEELRRLALVWGALVMRGSAVEGGGMPFHLWRQIMPALVLTVDLSVEEASIVKAIVHNIEALLGRPVPDPPALGGQSQQQRLVATIANIIKRQTRPTLIILEDLHWAGESLVPLRQLLDDVHELPLMLVGTYRPDERPRLPDELPGIQEMSLNRLKPHEVGALSRSMLGEASQPEVVSFLSQETEGNVYFVIEVLRALAEEAGGLGEIGRATLPPSLMVGGMQRILQRRLERVPDWAYGSLQIAAVAGRDLDLRVLEIILTPLLGMISAESITSSLLSVLWREERTINLQDWLMECADAAILEVREDHWRFSHDKLRQQLLADMEADQVAIFHRQVAEAIERAYPGDQRYASILAEHWFAAGEAEPTLHYTLVAASDLLLVGNFEKAYAILQRALSLASDQERQRMWLLQLLGEALEYRGDYEGAVAAYEEGLALARRLNSLEIAAHCHRGLGSVGWRVDDYQRGAEHSRQAMALYRDVESQWGVGETLNVLGLIAAANGDIVTADGYFRHSLAIHEELGDRWGIALCRLHMGHNAIHRGEYGNAHRHFWASLETFQAMEGQFGVAMALAGLGTVSSLLADFDTAERHLNRSHKIRRDIGDRWGVADSLSRLGQLALQDHDYRGAHAYLRDCLIIFKRIGSRRGLSTNMAILARVELKLGNLIPALEYMREALHLAGENVPLVLDGLVAGAYVLLAKDEPERAALLAGIVLYHESTSGPQKDALRGLMLDLDEALGDKAGTALERGAAFDVMAAVGELLGEPG